MKKDVKGKLEDLVGEILEKSSEDENTDTKKIPMIPLRGLTIFPYMVLHFDIGREKSISALEKAMVRNQLVFLVAQKDPELDLPTEDDFYRVGTVAKIKQMLKLPGEGMRVLVEGLDRAVIEKVIYEVPYFKAEIREIKDPVLDPIPNRSAALMRSVLSTFEDYTLFNPKLSGDIFPTVASVDQPGRLADVITSHSEMSTEDKQKILEAFDVEKRLELLNELLTKELDILKLEQDINLKVKDQINKSQREYYLREQMRAISEELGQVDDEDEIASWLEHLQELNLPEKIHEKIEKEINRLYKIQPSSPEGGVIRTYVETIFALPWNKYSEGKIEIKKAESILEEDHYGLEKVKERIVEYIAVIEKTGSLKGPILCLVGPPGVGKTSIAKSIARAVGREFVRISLGGVRDEAEIRGHRRTYIGAIPGRIISSMKDAGTMDPVFLLDEIDKVGNDFRGDPASALLEVLDPEQNKGFTDHYLEMPFDLSKVLFITTANTTDTIPRALLDRMEVIEVPGYTEEEKVKIAQKYLIPKQIKEHGLTKKEISITKGTVHDVINYYTRESGVRNLERQVANIARKVTRQIVEDNISNVKIDKKNLEDFLGKKVFRYDIISNKKAVGVTTGLAWTIVGGDTLSIETIVVDGQGKIVLTGQLGDVMKESAQTSISYIRSIAEKLKMEETFYKDKDIHLHIPEGATPKDGPSAGVTMTMALISTLTGIEARQDVAMTGEITLQGKVLPVGGIREKVLAAHRAGIKKVLVPKDNMRDINDVPENVREKMEFIFIEKASEAIPHVLMKDPLKK